MADRRDEIVMAEQAPQLEFDDVRVEVEARRVSKAGRPIALEPKAFDLLRYFLVHSGRVLAKEELLDAVWGEAFVTPNAMTRVIAQLRRALGDDAREARYIETVPTRGYRFIAVVRRIEPAIRGEAEVRRENHLVLLAGAALISLAVMFLLWQWMRRGSDAPRTSYRTTQLTSSPGLDLDPAFAPDGGAIAYSADRGEGYEIYLRPFTPGGRELPVTSDGGENLQPAYAPDGRRIAYHSRRRGGIWIVPATGGVAQQLSAFGSHPSWSPDGAWIAFQSDGMPDLGQAAYAAMPPSTLWRVKVSGGAPQQITRPGGPAGGHGAPAWWPDGGRLLFVTSDIGVSEIWSVRVDGSGLQRISSAPLLFYDPVIAPDGETCYVATGKENFEIWRWPLGNAGGEPARLANTGSALARHLTLSPDGRRLAYSAQTMSSHLGAVKLNGSVARPGSPYLLTQDTNYRKLRQMFSPDGSQIAYGVWRMGAEKEVWVMDADGRRPRLVTTEPGGLLGWLPDGDRLVVARPEGAEGIGLYAIDLARGGEQLLTSRPLASSLGRLSPDGKRLAFHTRSTDGAINTAVVEVAGGEARQLTFERELAGFPVWSPDNRWLALEIKRGAETRLGLVSVDGGAVEMLTEARGQSWPGSFSPDGDRIVFAGLRDGVWNVWWVSRRDRRERRVTSYTRPNLYVRAPAWSPRGDLIVYEYAETRGNIWALEFKPE